MKLFLVLAAVALVARTEDLDDEDVEERAFEKSTFKTQKHFLAGDDSIGNDTTIIASLRETPAEVHLCSASFIRQDALITTAKCIYGKVPDRTYVHCYSRFTSGSGISVPVRKFKAHPHFEMTPQVNDIGLIFTAQYLSRAFVHALPLPWQNHRGSVTVYQWKFGKNNVVFSLHELIVEIITNSKCSIILKNFIDCKYLCGGKKQIHHGSMDHGTPMSGRHGNTTYILGLYNREGPDRNLEAEQYEKIYPHVDWINYVLKKNPKANTPAVPLQEVKPAKTT